MKSNVYRQELMFVASFEFGSLPLCNQVFCQCTASLSEHTGTLWGGEEKQRSSAACCRLPWWNWTINILPNLPSLSVTTLQLETCLCSLILYQQLFSPLEVLLSFSVPILNVCSHAVVALKKGNLKTCLPVLVCISPRVLLCISDFWIRWFALVVCNILSEHWLVNVSLLHGSWS